MALILQNEEFLSELREDEDFMKTLERGRCCSQPCVDVREREREGGPDSTERGIPQ